MRSDLVYFDNTTHHYNQVSELLQLQTVIKEDIKFMKSTKSPFYLHNIKDKYPSVGLNHFTTPMSNKTAGKLSIKHSWDIIIMVFYQVLQ